MERGMDINEVLSHDLLPVTPLFQGEFHTCTSKSTLVGENETKLDLQQWNKNACLSSHIVVDFMSKVRQMPLKEMSTLGELVNATISSVTGICHEQECIHLVLDSYLEYSLKEGERLKRTDVSPIEIIGMNTQTPVPRQLEKIWSSEKKTTKRTYNCWFEMQLLVLLTRNPLSLLVLLSVTATCFKQRKQVGRKSQAFKAGLKRQMPELLFMLIGHFV